MPAPVKIALIVDKSDAYIHFMIERILKEWGVVKADLRTVTSLSSVGAPTLFGDSPTSLYPLSTPEDIKKFNEDYAGIPTETLYNTFEAGLIVTTTVARTSTKKLEDNLKKIGATLYIPPGTGDEHLVIKLINQMGLTRPVKDFLISYVGTEYDALIPLVDSLSSLPKEQHSRITEEDILIRFTQEKGDVAGWLIEKPLLAGNIPEAIDVLRRVNRGRSFLIILATLKNKFYPAYRAAALLADNPRISDALIVEGLGLSNTKQVYFIKKLASTYGLQVLEKVVLALARTENAVKGGSAAPSMATMEALLVEICLTLKKVL